MLTRRERGVVHRHNLHGVGVREDGQCGRCVLLPARAANGGAAYRAAHARTLNGELDAFSAPLSHVACMDVAVLPSGSLQSVSSMKKATSGTTCA